MRLRLRLVCLALSVSPLVTAQVQAQEPVLELTLSDAIQQALAKNFTI